MNNKNQLNMFTSKESILIVDAMKMIDLNTKGILFIVNESNQLVGSMTDGDIRRWLIKTGKLNVSASDIMNQEPKYIFEVNRDDAKKYMKKNFVKALPVVDIDRHIIDVIFDEDIIIKDMTEKDMLLSDTSVIIMAGGKGTRLYPYTKILPKPLIPIGEIPIIERIINNFFNYGATEFYLTVNYKKEMIKSYFSELNTEYKIYYVEEPIPLGTAGSINLINKKFDSPLIITNCDILIDVDYSSVMKYHKESGNELTIVSALKNITIPYGVLQTRENGIISSLEEKPSLSYFINTGVYIINPELIDKIPTNEVFHMTDLVELLMEEGFQTGVYPVSEEAFLDMGELNEMKRMEEKLSI